MLPLGYSKTIRWEFYDDADATVPTDLSAWSAWQLAVVIPAIVRWSGHL